jgi:cytoskeletal protein RodZ
MGPWRKLLVHVAWIAMFVSGLPGAVMPLAAQQAVASAPQDLTNPPLLARAEPSAPISELPDSPGAVVSQSQQSAQPQPGSGASASQPAQTQSQSQPPAQKPVGTAAAEAPDASGIAASQPAGVAIAPAKQRRTRTLILRLGALIGAGAAIGSVVALTSATSSKPPGAH